jgi:crossover junction endodeoxyribonuclease RusA
MHMRMELPYPPASGNHQHGMRRDGKRFTLPVIAAYRSSVYMAFLAARGVRVSGAVRVMMDLHPPDARRRDSDNVEKVVFDALTRAGVIDDDSCIRTHTTTWCAPVRGGRVVVAVEVL